MFLFYHTQQDQKNISHYKGILFEQFLKKLLEKLGYNNISLRRKHNSLEYDIEGTHSIHNRQTLISEAKGHTNTISSKEITSFVGKLIPLGLIDKKVLGVFFSTSSLSPDAEDYFSQLKDISITKYCGEELFNLTCKEFELPKDAVLIKKLPSIFSHTASFLLITDTDFFKLLICRSSQKVSPDFFAIFDSKSNLISDSKFLDTIKDYMKELQELTPIMDNKVKPKIRSSGEVIESGLQLSTDWTDYKLPASPTFFIGRLSTLQKINKEIFKLNTSLIQIKSRSGVGKSSLLAFVANKYFNEYPNELHDSRDIKSPLDIYLIIQRFTSSSMLATDFKGIYDQLKMFSSKIQNKAFFFVDQFESTFNRKEIFETYESLFNLFQKFKDKIVVFIARKNDQLTTLDDVQVSLDKLNSISKSITLKDFEKDEAVLLMKKIIEAQNSSINKKVLSYVLEFSQGFPWLIKRTMAHVIEQLSAGVSQNDLIATGLKLDDLFNEELAGLDEMQADYLTRIVQNLPATYNQLHKIFDEDPLIKQMLENLTVLRLIRLSGSTYDTYNDVLKEYILYKKLPLFKQKYLLRSPPSTTIQGFLKISKQKNINVMDIDLITSILNTKKGTALNLIREWKMLNLINSSTGKWKIPSQISDIISQGYLGDYIRRELAKNEIVANILSSLTRGKTILQKEIPKILSDECPFIDASNDTWNAYSKTILSWMTVFRLIEINNSSNALSLPTQSKDTIISDLGNMTFLSRRKMICSNIYIPSYQYSYTEKFINKFIGVNKINVSSLNKKEKKGYADLKKGGWIENKMLIFNSVDEFKIEVKKLLNKQLSSFWNTVKNGGDLLDSMKEISFSSTPKNMSHIIKILLSWGKALNIIENKRYRYSNKPKKS